MRFTCSRAVLIGAIVAAAGAVAGAQQTPATPSPSQQPVFKSSVDLVTVDVTVVDRDGKPVKGLKPDDFVVTLDGKRRVVRALDYLEFGGSASSTNAQSPPQATNQAAQAAQSRGGRVILLVVDDLSAKPGQMTGLRTAAQRMLATLDLGDLVGVATTSGLGPVVNPTRDRAAVRTALESKEIVGRYDENTAPFYISIPEAIEINQVVSSALAREGDEISKGTSTFARVIIRECFGQGAGPAGSKGQSIDATCDARVIYAAIRLAEDIIHRAAAQLAAYAQLIDALRHAPAPRVIIAFSAGVATGAEGGSFGELNPVSLAAAKAGVQFYALTEIADLADVTDTSSDRAAARRAEDAFLTAGVQTVAEAAGGEAFKVVGQADRFFNRIVTETSGMYQLAVEAPAVPSTNEFVNVKVSVGRSDVAVRTNAHALATSAGPAPPPAPVADALQTRIAQGGTAYGVPIALATARRRGPATSTQVQLGINVQVPGSVSAPIETMFGIIDEAGKMVQSGRKELPEPAAGEDYHLALPVLLAEGSYRVRFAASDAHGNVGAIEQSVTVRLEHKGSFSVSDLFTTWTDVGGTPKLLAFETLPAAATKLRVSLELYPDTPTASADDLTIRLAVMRAGDDHPPIETNLTPTRTGTGLSVSSDIDPSALEPGTYTVRATILEAGVVTGTVTTSIRKRTVPRRLFSEMKWHTGDHSVGFE
jgi:VWFA-related protein